MPALPPSPKSRLAQPPPSSQVRDLSPSEIPSAVIRDLFMSLPEPAHGLSIGRRAPSNSARRKGKSRKNSTQRRGARGVPTAEKAGRTARLANRLASSVPRLLGSTATPAAAHETSRPPARDT